MSSITYNIAYLHESLGELEGYLLSDDLFDRLHAKAPIGEPPFASLTLGNVLLARKELQCYALDDHQIIKFRELDINLETLRSRWRVAWERKARREYSYRMRQWARFLEEYRREPEKNADRYPYEVRQRVILALLGEESPRTAAENEAQLFTLDELLKRDFIEGEFVWDEGMREGFERQRYWYLWGRVREG